MWETIKREELFEGVWSTPLTQLCAKLRVVGQRAQEGVQTVECAGAGGG